MTTRITVSHLRKLCASLNAATDSPAHYWQDKESRSAALGHHTISCAYGGYALHRVCSPGGGLIDIFACGHVSARTLYCMMQAYLQGFADGKRKAQSLSPQPQEPQYGPT